jgi:predicted tellurium resistance membrane protein TerC
MAELFTSENLVAFLTLLALEIVLGIDNVIFIAILAGKLPADSKTGRAAWALAWPLSAALFSS